MSVKLGNDPQSLLVLTPLERAVLQAAGAALGEFAPALAAQVEQARVVSRSHSGVGFVTRLSVTGSVTPLPAPGPGAVHASHPGLAEPAEFLLQIKDGRLAAIEAYCREGIWPADEAAFSIRPASRQ
jgi:hypothetical protein